MVISVDDNDEFHRCFDENSAALRSGKTEKEREREMGGLCIGARAGVMRRVWR